MISVYESYGYAKTKNRERKEKKEKERNGLTPCILLIPEPLDVLVCAIVGA